MSGLSRHIEAFGAILLAVIWVAPLVFAFFDAPHAAAMTILVLVVLGVVAGIKFTILDKRTHYQ